MFTPLQCIFSEVTYQHWLFRDSTTQAQALSHVNIGSVLSRICFETPDSLWRKGLATNRFRDKWSRPQERFLFLQTCQEFQNECATERCQYSRDSKLAPAWSNLWKVSSEKRHCNGVNVHLYMFLTPVCRIPFTRFQNRETMKYTVRTVPDLKLCKCAGDIVWTLKMCWWKWWR